MSKDTIADKVLDELISQAVITAVDKHYEDIDIIEDIEFSEEHNRKMKKIFRREKNSREFYIFLKIVLFSIV